MILHCCLVKSNSIIPWHVHMISKCITRCFLLKTSMFLLAGSVYHPQLRIWHLYLVIKRHHITSQRTKTRRRRRRRSQISFSMIRWKRFDNIYIYNNRWNREKLKLKFQIRVLILRRVFNYLFLKTFIS